MTTVTIALLRDGAGFSASGGDPAGRDEVHATLSRWPGWRRKPDGYYTAPPWVSSVAGIPSLLPFELKWSEGAAALREKLVGAMRVAREHLNGRPIPFPSDPLPTARTPLKHQWQAIHALRCMSWRALLTDEMGLGKTSTALWAASDAAARIVVVVCPISVKFNWEKEIRETLGEWPVVVVDGPAKRRADQLAEASASWAAGQLALIINYDLLRHLSDHQKAGLQEIAKGAFCIFDESHYLKSLTAERTRLCRTLFADASYKLALTGTPVRNMVDDLFSQIDLVRPGVWSSYRDFAKRHLVINQVDFGKRTVQKIVGAKDIDGLNAVVNTLQVRRMKRDVLDLPPKTRTFPELQLDEVTGRIYKACKEFALLKLNELTEQGLDSNTVTVFEPRAKSAVEAAMRCEQIAQGFLGGIPEPVMAQIQKLTLKHAVSIPGRPAELLFPDSPKIKWLLEAIDNVLVQGGRPVVFSRFNAPMLWLEQQYATSRFIHGGLSAIERSVLLDSFAKGEVKVLLCQVKIAEGFNLAHSQDILFYGRDWSPAINAQAEDRCHRMGQLGTVNIQIPIVRKTIEVMLHNRLISKDSDAQQALKGVTIQQLMEAL